MSDIIRGLGTFGSIMRRYSTAWLAPILLSSVVTGGGTFVLLTVTTDLPLAIVTAVSGASVLVGDIVLALLMQAVSPTHVTLGPGERRHNAEPPQELGTVATSFRGRRGFVSIRGETWQARQAIDCGERLETGGVVRIVDREGLMLIVAASD